MLEAVLQRTLLARLNAMDGVWAWRSNTGAAQRSGGQMVRFGKVGQADISGILRGGRRLEIEVKSTTGKQTAAQRAFGERIAELGGLYIVATDIRDVEIQVLDALRLELSSR